MNFKIVFLILLSICSITFQCFIENAIQIIKKKLNNDCIFIIKPGENYLFIYLFVLLFRKIKFQLFIIYLRERDKIKMLQNEVLQKF